MTLIHRQSYIASIKHQALLSTQANEIVYTSELVPLLPLTVLPNRLKQSLDDLELLIEQSRTITACDEDNDNEGSHFSDPSDEENVSAAEDDNAGKQEASIDENLRFYIKCLMDLVPTMEQTLQHVQTPHQPNVHPAQVLFSLSQPAQTYVMNVYDKFTRADTKLVERLGEANYQYDCYLNDVVASICSRTTCLTLLGVISSSDPEWSRLPAHLEATPKSSPS